jgi:hypothetical protein
MCIILRWVTDGSQGYATRPERLRGTPSVLPRTLVLSERAGVSQPGIWFLCALVSRSFLRTQEHLGEYGRNIGCVQDYTHRGWSSPARIFIGDHFVRHLEL